LPKLLTEVYCHLFIDHSIHFLNSVAMTDVISNILVHIHCCNAGRVNHLHPVNSAWPSLHGWAQWVPTKAWEWTGTSRDTLCSCSVRCVWL